MSMLNLLFLASSEFIEADSSGVTWGATASLRHYESSRHAGGLHFLSRLLY